MKLSNMEARTRGVSAELIVELDGIHFEAIRLGIGDEAADVAQRLRTLAARIEHRAAAGVKDRDEALRIAGAAGPLGDPDVLAHGVTAAVDTLPLDMVLHCPKCHTQHVDEPDERTTGWDNPPHKSHLCHGCGCIWRPADVPTNGVREVKTRGKADTWPSGVKGPDHGQ